MVETAARNPSSSRMYAGKSAQARSEERVGRLLDAALELFGSQGYTATTIEMLCTTSNVSTRSFYEQFGSRERVLTMLVEKMNRAGEQAAAEALSASTPDVTAAVESGLRAYLGVTCRDHKVARVCYVEVIGVSAAIESWRREQREQIVRLFGALAATAAERGEIERRDYRLLILAVIGAANMYAQEWVSLAADAPESDLSFAPYIDELARIARRAVGGP